MSAWAVPGAKCICVRDPYLLVDGGYPPFRKGDVLTVAASHMWAPHGLMLRFVEREIDHWGHVDGFRPLITKSQEQDVGLFVHHLESTPVGEDA